MTNEPKVNEVVNITECHEFAEVTTRSDVGAGLESGVIGGGEERESLVVGGPATIEIRPVVSTAFEAERIEYGDRPPFGQPIGPQTVTLNRDSQSFSPLPR